MFDYRIDWFFVVDGEGRFVGIIMMSDFVKRRKYWNVVRDENGDLFVVVVVGFFDFERVKVFDNVGVDVIVVDMVYVYNFKVIKVMKEIRNVVDVDFIVGNIVNLKVVDDFIFVDVVKVGIGLGSICIMRVVVGVGVF